jgi:hypothetical protein
MNANLGMLAQCVALVASIIFLLIPTGHSRSRAAWANALFVTVGIVGVLVSGTKLLLLLHWIAPSAATVGTIHQARVLLCGFALGLILALILSGQLVGSKQNRQGTHGATA